MLILNVIFLLIKLEIRKEQEEPKIFITVFSSDIPKLSLSQYGGAARRELQGLWFLFSTD